MSKAKNKKKSTYTPTKKNPAKALVLFTSIFILLLVALFLINQANTKKDQAQVRVDELPSIVNQPVIGQPNAPVTMIEFGDYKCPSCKTWSEVVSPQLKEEYIDTGKMKLVYINTLFHGEESTLGALAAEAVLAQNEQAYWPFHHALFQAQPSDEHNEPWITEEKIVEIAKTITPQIDIQALQNDLKNKIRLPEVDIDTALVNKYQIAQTPTLMINGIIMDNPFDLVKIKSVLDQELGGE